MFPSSRVQPWPKPSDFSGRKILSTPSFGREVKLFVPCRIFAACKRSLNVAWKSGIFRQNSSAIYCSSSSSFPFYGLWWRHLAVQVGTTKDQGLYNKPSAAVNPGELAAGTLSFVWKRRISQLLPRYFNQFTVYNSHEYLQNTPFSIQKLGKLFNMNYVWIIFKTELNWYTDNTACTFAIYSLH